MFPCTTGLFVASGPRCNKEISRYLLVRKALRDCVRFQVSTLRAPERCDWNDLILLILCQLETHPEAVRGLPRPPALLAESTLSIIRHVAGLHVRVAPDAFERLFHVHLSPRRHRTPQRALSIIPLPILAPPSPRNSLP